MDVNIPSLERQKWSCGCSKDRRHKMLVASTNTVYEHLNPSWKDTFSIFANNLAVGFTRLSKADALREFVVLFMWKFDLFLDVQYIVHTPISTNGIKWLLISSILIPYLYIIVGSFSHLCHEIFPRAVFGIFNLSHWIELPYFQERKRI
jgi:hypothetical protein